LSSHLEFKRFAVVTLAEHSDAGYIAALDAVAFPRSEHTPQALQGLLDVVPGPRGSRD